MHHPTPTASLTLVPCSPTVASLLHQLQAEAIQEAHGLAVVPPEAIVLPALRDARARFSERDDVTVLHIRAKDSVNADTFRRYRAKPEGWDADWWNPAHWHLNMSRKGSDGKVWSTYGPAHVMDDFGMLVPAEGGAA